MELIKDRLAHIIRAKNLTATQFAEMMQIQPSNVSHLLSGRNKPSLDFLIKLKDIFPEYSFDWIILGKKPITMNDRGSLMGDNLFKPAELFDTTVAEELKKTSITENYHDENLNNTMESELFDTDVARFSKKVKQIVYVYEDHTFEIYDVRK